MSVTLDDESVSATLEAACRVRMAEIAALPNRGWDTQRNRNAKLAELDALLDDWQAAR